MVATSISCFPKRPQSCSSWALPKLPLQRALQTSSLLVPWAEQLAKGVVSRPWNVMDLAQSLWFPLLPVRKARAGFLKMTSADLPKSMLPRVLLIAPHLQMALQSQGLLSIGVFLKDQERAVPWGR